MVSCSFVSLLNWHHMLQLVDPRRDKTGQTIDNVWNNHKQHQHGITRTSRSISQLQIPIARMAQVFPCSGIRRFISCLFWSTISAKLCWLLRAVLRNLIPRSQILGLFIRMTLICSFEQVSDVSLSLLMKAKEESVKAGFKLNIQINKIMAFGPITSYKQIGKQWKY